eukprot:9473284-Pyramimonas_sp.AAC.1
MRSAPSSSGGRKEKANTNNRRKRQRSPPPSPTFAARATRVSAILSCSLEPAPLPPLRLPPVFLPRTRALEETGAGERAASSARRHGHATATARKS